MQHSRQETPACKSGLYLIAEFAPSGMLQGGLGWQMVAHSYDIFRRDQAGEIWVEAVRDLDTAKSRIIELSANTPGQYVVFNHRSGRMVGSGTVVASPAARATPRELQKTTERSEESTEVESDTLW